MGTLNLQGTKMLKNQCFFVQNFRKDADALLKTC